MADMLRVELHSIREVATILKSIEVKVDNNTSYISL